MVEFTLLTKGIFIVLIVIFVWKTSVLSVVFSFINNMYDRVSKKLGFYNSIKRKYNVEVRQRKKFIDRFVKNIKRNDEL